MYAVVEFVNEGEVAIVPDSWLVGRQKCKWPQWKSTSKIDRAIKQQQEAGSDFKTLPIRIFYETESYEVARTKLRQAEISSDLQSEAEDSQSQKRKKRPNKRYFDSDSDESDGPSPKSPSGVSESPRRSPRLANKSRGVYPPIRLPTPPRFGNVASSRRMPEECAPSIRTPVTPPITSTPSDKRTGARTTLFDMGNQGTPSPISQQTVSAVQRKIITLLEEIKSQTSHNNILLKTITESNRGPVEQYQLNEGNVQSFPLCTMADLDAVEDDLKSNEGRRKLLLHTGVIGGENTQNCTRRIMAFLISNGLAKQLNWSGKGTKRAFSKLMLTRSIKDAVRRNKQSSTATDSDIEGTIKKWLQFAADREGGRRERERKKRERESSETNEANNDSNNVGNEDDEN